MLSVGNDGLAMLSVDWLRNWNFPSGAVARLRSGSEILKNKHYLWGYRTLVVALRTKDRLFWWWLELSPPEVSTPVFPPGSFPPCEICRWREPVPTRVPNPNASKASYKPEQRRGGSIHPEGENFQEEKNRGGTQGWKLTGGNGPSTVNLHLIDKSLTLLVNWQCDTEDLEMCY